MSVWKWARRVRPWRWVCDCGVALLVVVIVVELFVLAVDAAPEKAEHDVESD